MGRQWGRELQVKYAVGDVLNKVILFRNVQMVLTELCLSTPCILSREKNIKMLMLSERELSLVHFQRTKCENTIEVSNYPLWQVFLVPYLILHSEAQSLQSSYYINC